MIYGAVAMKLGSFRLSSAFVKGREQNKIVRPTEEKNDRGEGKREREREGGRRQSDNDFARSKDPLRRTTEDDVDEIPGPFLFLA